MAAAMTSSASSVTIGPSTTLYATADHALYASQGSSQTASATTTSVPNLISTSSSASSAATKGTTSITAPLPPPPEASESCLKCLARAKVAPDYKYEPLTDRNIVERYRRSLDAVKAFQRRLSKAESDAVHWSRERDKLAGRLEDELGAREATTIRHQQQIVAIKKSLQDAKAELAANTTALERERALSRSQLEANSQLVKLMRTKDARIVELERQLAESKSGATKRTSSMSDVEESGDSQESLSPAKKSRQDSEELDLEEDDEDLDLPMPL